ncbi:related to ELO1 - Elongase I [Ustilago sp. UG-2017a]|nr:related to ELO1 - Elongase I [Ustilago sp. UG-2017a]
MSTFFGLKAKPYPLDPAFPGSTPWDTLWAPYPRYSKDDKLFRKALSPSVYNATLTPWLPLGFSLAYYFVAHAANAIVTSDGNKDYTKAPGLLAKVLRFLILIHNAALALYSGWTWAMMFPYVVDFFIQGWRAARMDGVKLALCSMPTNCPHLGKYAYIFYLSKYYEVFDSLILLLKGKRVSNLQSYHHAGAIICMWIAYRYQSQAVWVFCLFNSFVHTCMYTYYFCAAMRWPFPRAVKRNLTTMQIAQIASGTLLTNLYLLIKLDPTAVLKAYKANKVSSWFQPAATRDQLVFIHALARAASSEPTTCMQTTGAEIALHLNTMYMFPLLALFFNFFMRSYLQKSPSAKNGDVKKALRAINGKEK